MGVTGYKGIWRWREIYRRMCRGRPRGRESRNISSWKGPVRIIESNSLLLAEALLKKDYSLYSRGETSKNTREVRHDGSKPNGK